LVIQLVEAQTLSDKHLQIEDELLSQLQTAKTSSLLE
jgi:hypothetical protein